MNPPGRKSPERELVLSAQAGDAKAVAELFTRFWRAARASAYSVVPDISRAEDAAAEAFRLAVPALKKLRDPDQFAPWLRRIVLRVAQREATWRNRATDLASEGARSDTADPALSLQRQEMALLVRDAVERLPPAEREAIVLFYFEGYASEEAARFLAIPVGSLRRRLHDGRLRLRGYLTEVLDRAVSEPTSTSLRASVQTLLANDASPNEWYEVMRDVLLSRPVPFQLLASLLAGISISAQQTDVASRLLVRPQGPLFDDPGPLGEAARTLRTILSDFQEWTLDSKRALLSFPSVIRQAYGDRSPNIDPTLALPRFPSDHRLRCLRVTRGLLFGEAAGIDPAELFLRSESLATFARQAQPAWLSDVLDVYWTEPRPIELSEVEAWITRLANQVAPAAQARCSAQPALRYRFALRLAFAGDGRPAAIGGVLTVWPGAPEGISGVHVRIYLEPWAQGRSGQIVAAQSLPRPDVGTKPDKE